MEPSLIPELKVSSFKTSLDFYMTILGFEVLYARVEEDFAMLNLNGAQIMLEGIRDDVRMWTVGELAYPLGRGVNFQIEVKDVSSLYDQIRANNLTILQEMEVKWYRVKDHEAGNKQFCIQDPDGYLLRFYEDLGER